MELDDLIEYCMAKSGVEETTPFGPDTLVYKVAGKMFALAGVEDYPARVNLKCDPDRALELRGQYDAVIPGYHMNKRHWNTVILDGSLGDVLERDLVDHSYALVVAGLTKQARATLE